MANMYLICGISGSGKTTYAKKLAQEENLVRLDIDEFYEKVNGDECNRENKFEVWIEFFKAIHELEESETDCIVETAGLTAYQRREFVEWFPKFKHHLIFIDSDKRTRRKNNKSRRRQVPKWRMKQMERIVEKPNLDSSDKLFNSIQILNNSSNTFYNVSYTFLF